MSTRLALGFASYQSGRPPSRAAVLWGRSGLLVFVQRLLSSLFSSAIMDFLAGRQLEVVECFVAHGPLMDEVCDFMRDAFHSDVMQFQHERPLQKAPQLPAKESTLVDTSLDMVGAVRASLELSFPFVTSLHDGLCKALVPVLAHVGKDIVQMRAARRRALATAKKRIAPLTDDLRALVRPFSKPINGSVDFGLLECLLRVCKWPHFWLVDLLIYGFQPVGEVPVSGCHRPVDEPSQEAFSRASNLKAFDDAVEHLERKARRAQTDAQSLSDQVEVWDTTIGECERGFCVGPLTRKQVCDMFKDTPYGPRPIPAFGIWQNGKLRRIDDALFSLHNALTYMRETIACITAEFPAAVAAEFAKYISLEELGLRLGTDDIASAYRILVNAWPEYSVAAVWRPAARGGPGVSYFALRGYNFGLKSAPVHLATLMDALVHVTCKCGLVVGKQFYDDVAVVDQVCGANSAQSTLNHFFSLLGFPFAPRKHVRSRFANPFLGVVSDFAHVRAGYVVVRVKEKRRRRLLSELSSVLESGVLTPAHASRLRGKLFFTTSSAFFGVGRPALQAFTERQYAKFSRRFRLNPSLRASLNFFKCLLGNLPAARVHLLPDSTRPLYIWSDAMWEPLSTGGSDRASAIDAETGEVFYIARAAVAFVCYDPVGNVWYESSKSIGLKTIKLMVPGKKTYIGQLEMLAEMFVLESLPAEVLVGRSAMFWIDNLSAKYGLQKAYAKVEDSGRILNAFKIKRAALNLRCWFEYVPSKQNVADLPSRGDFAGMREVIDAVSASGWTLFSLKAVLPNFSTWDAPLAVLPRRSRKRHGSRGAKRRRGHGSADAVVGAVASS